MKTRSRVSRHAILHTRSRIQSQISRAIKPVQFFIVAVTISAHSAAGQSITRISAQHQTASFMAVSSDGRVVVGSGDSAMPWRWENGQLITPPFTPDGTRMLPTGLSADGSISCGYAGENDKSFVFSGGVYQRLLAPRLATDPAYARAISLDGHIVVGIAIGPVAVPVKWVDGAVTVLPSSSSSSGALAVSGDGSVIAGYDGDFAARWDNGALSRLPLLHTSGAQAWAVSADGQATVGYATTGGNPPGSAGEPVLWENGGVQGLGLLPGKTDGIALGVANCGRRVVGYCSATYTSDNRAFLWTPEEGMRSLAEVLASIGISTNGWVFWQANAITPDGRYLIGQGEDHNTGWGGVFIVDLGLPIAPIITTQPQSQTVLAGTALSFLVVAPGAQPLSYQWRRNGSNLVDDSRISGAGSPTLSLSSARSEDAGSYDVVVSGSACSVTSSAAILTVTSQPSTTLYAFTNFAGLPGEFAYADGVGRDALFSGPSGVAVDDAGAVCVVDQYNNTIRKVTPGGSVTTLAGSADNSGSADGTGSAAQFNNPLNAAVDGAGNIYVTDSGNQTIRKVTPAGVVTTLAGSPGNVGCADGAGSAAQFSTPVGVAVDGAGNVYVADAVCQTIRKITPGGVVTTLAGSAGVQGSADGTGSAARFLFPQGLALDRAGNIFVADGGNNTIRKVTPNGIVTTLAGSAGNPGSANGMGSAARFSFPSGLAVDDGGNVFVADAENNTIRKVTPEGVVTTIGGTAGSVGDADGIGTAARFSYPASIAVNAAGNLYVADQNNSRISKGTPLLATPPPMISGCPNDLTVATTPGRASCDQVVTWTPPTASASAGVADLTSDHNPGDVFPVGATTVTYTAKDAAGNTTTCSFTVTVNDTTPPVLTGCPGNITVNTGPGRTSCDQVASWTPPTASDNCAVTSFASDHNPGDVFPVGTTTVTYTARDAASNTTTCSFTVTVNDTTPPVLTGCPGNITVNTGPGRTSCDQVASWTPPTASDNCAVTSFASDHNPGDVFPVGTTTVTYTARDASNTTTCSFTVTVNDTTPPIITGCPGNITVNTGPGRSSCDQVATWTPPTASDNCAVTSFASDRNPGDTFPVGTTTVTYTARDAAGNTSICSSTVTVVDTTPPILGACPASGPYILNSGLQTTAQVSTSDNCGINNGASALACTVDTSSVGSKSLTFRAVDTAGNTSSRTCSCQVIYQPAGVSCTINGASTPGHQILQPVNANPPYSVFKQGNVIPLKFMVFDGNCNPVGTPGVVAAMTLIGVLTGTTSDVNESIVSATPDNTFRWDPSSQQWVFNLSTKNLPKNATFYYTISLNDGTTINFQFGLK